MARRYEIDDAQWEIDQRREMCNIDDIQYHIVKRFIQLSKADYE